MKEKGKIYMSGSFTVEASLVVSMILLVLFYVLQMTFFLTDTVRLEAVVAEMSLDVAQEVEMSGFFCWMSPVHSLRARREM